MEDKLLQQANREYGSAQRFVAILIEGVFFIGILPVALIALAPRFDRWLLLPRFVLIPLSPIVGGYWQRGAFSLHCGRSTSSLQ